MDMKWFYIVGIGAVAVVSLVVAYALYEKGTKDDYERSWLTKKFEKAYRDLCCEWEKYRD